MRAAMSGAAGKRIAVGGFLHESNSFVPELDVGFDYFTVRRDRPPLLRGQAVLTELQDASFCLAGFLQAADPRHTLLPLVWTSGGAGGKVLDEAFERIVGEMLERLAAVLPVDAVYLDLHGAMVTPDYPDAEGELLRRVRAMVGEGVPVVATLDYHANVSPQMLQWADSLIAFRTYPHVDRVPIGRHAAQVVERLLHTGRPVGRAIRHAPFLIPLEGQCTLVEPSHSLVAVSQCDAGEVVSLAYAAGFPPGDTYWTGPSYFAYADSQSAADAVCTQAMAAMLAREGEFEMPLWNLADAVKEARRTPRGTGGPVILADIQDNPGAGARSDTTGILAELVRTGAEDAVVGLLHDPAAAAQAHAAGVGGRVRVALGGSAREPGNMPMDGDYLVERLGDGRFITTGSVAGGNPTELGPMAVLRIGGVRVVVSSRRMQAFDPAPFVHVGLDVSRRQILVLKSTCHFRADFEPLARRVMCVIAPGDSLADPTLYAYQNLRAEVRRRAGGQ